MDKPTIGHYASHQRDVTAQEDAALNAALRSSTAKVEHPEIARLRAELAQCRKDAERFRFIQAEHDRHDPVGRVGWKLGSNRNGGEWVDIASGEALAQLIDYEISTTKIDRL